MPVINGKHESIEGITLEEYLSREGFNKEHVVVERNLEIIPREKLSTIRIESDDVIEILNFVGGGC